MLYYTCKKDIFFVYNYLIKEQNPISKPQVLLRGRLTNFFLQNNIVIGHTLYKY